MISVLKEEDDDALEMRVSPKTINNRSTAADPAAAAEGVSAMKPKQQRHAEVKYPDYLMSSFLSFLVFIMAATMRGIQGYSYYQIHGLG